VEAVFEVVFSAPGAAPGGADHHDSLMVLSDAGDVEVPLRALAPKPRLRLLPPSSASDQTRQQQQPSPTTSLMRSSPAAAAAKASTVGLLEYRLVAAGSSLVRRVRLVNEGSRPTDWKAAVDGCVGVGA